MRDIHNILAAIIAAAIVPLVAFCEEIAVDGVLWHYDVVSGGAVIRAVGVEADETEASAVEELEIPAEISGHRVVGIGEGAFSGQDALREVHISDGITRIGERAFKDCRGLDAVYLPESVVEIGERAFSGCRSLKSVKLGDNVTNIAARAFRDCRALVAIDLPENLVAIGEKAFADCSALRAVTVPRGVTNIGASAFADCSSLGVVVFLGAEPSVGEDAFERVDENCYFRASGSGGWSVKIPGVWQGRKIVDLAIDAYRRRTLIFLPMIVGSIGTVAILVLAIVLRERRNDDEE